MKLNKFFIACVIPIVLGSPVLAQEQSSKDFSLPQGCEKAGHMAGNMAVMESMGNMEAMQQSMGGHMSDATKGYMRAIVEMHPPMVQGAMAQDPDVAFNCSMIAHHKGAIAMAKIQLQYGKDDEAKKMAQKTIDEQSKEVDEMTKWVEDHAK